MQITSGLVTLTQGSSLVQGNSSVDWTQVTPGCLFIAQSQIFTINSVDAVAKQLQISPNWTSASVANLAYVIARDFTSNLQLPLVNNGDLEVPALLSRAMMLLDALNTSSADPTITDHVITKTSHGFIVGNALRFNGGVWALADSTSTTNSIVLGVVSKVVDANTFWLRIGGKVGGISPIQGITLTSGTMYYLRLSPLTVSVEISPGVFQNRQVNICTGLLADAGELLVPVLQADSTTSGYMPSLATAQTNIFGVNKAGLVPNPGASLTGRVLKDTGWASSGLADDAIQSRHLDPTAITIPATSTEWNNFQNQVGSTPIHPFIMDLQRRLKAMEDSAAVEPYLKKVITRKEFTSGDWSWSIPGGTRYLALTLITGDTNQQYQSNFSPVKGVSPYSSVFGNTSLRVLLYVEGATTLSGRIEDVLRGSQTPTSFPDNAKITVKLDGNTILTLTNTLVQTTSLGSLVTKVLRPAFTLALPQTKPALPPYYYILSYAPYESTLPLVSYHFDVNVDLLDQAENAYVSHYTLFGAQGLLSGAVVIERGRIAV